ncbi:shikimate kinase [Luteimonas pelagia]
MRNAPNLVLVGPMGAGKSSIGRLLADRFRVPFVDLDRAIEALAGVSIAQIFEREGETGFRERERTELARVLAGERQVVATGGGSVLDARNRERLRSRACVAWLRVPLHEQLRRVAGDRERPLLATGDPATVLQLLAAERDPLYADVADLRFDTGGLDAPRAADALARELDGCWAPEAAP